MKVMHVYEKGMKEINEDACVLNEKAKIFAAVDGATGLEGTPGYIASQAVKKVLDKGNAGEALISLVQAANETVQEDTMNYYDVNMQTAGVDDFSDIPKVGRSSTALAAIRILPEETCLEYVHAADCMLFLQYDTGAVRMITQDLLQELDDIAIRELAEKRKQDKFQHLSMQELRDMVNPILIENRGKANTLGGYSVIDGSKEALDFLEWGRISLNRVSQILLVSDGLQMPHRMEETDAWMQTARLAFSDGLTGLLAEVQKREEADPDCDMYPRLKKSDDKTAILIAF